MATRARIGILNPDNTVTSVYHHWDGYPEWLGKKLVEKFNSEEDALNLMNLGDMSCIESDTDWNRQECEPTILTYAGRGEDRPAKYAKSMKEYYEQCSSCWADYAYLWKEDQWVGYSVRSNRLYKVKIPTKTN